MQSPKLNMVPLSNTILTRFFVIIQRGNPSLFPAFGCNSVRAKLRSFKAAATTLATLHTEAEARVETLLV